MFRKGLLAGALLLIVTACGGSATPSDSTEASAADDGASEVAATTTQTQADSTDSTVAAESTTTQPSAGGASETLVAIQDRGVINVAVGLDFERDLAAAVAEVLVPGIQVAYSEVSAAQRFLAVQAGEVDMGIRNTTHTTSREAEAVFSQPYLLVALVFADSGIVSIADLEGKTIAVLVGTSTGLILEEALAEAGVTATVRGFESGAQVEESLLSGQAHAAVTNWLSAADRASDSGGTLSIVPIDVLSEPIAIFTSPGDPAFAAEVRSALQTVIDDGTWLSLFEKSFGGPPPWTVEEMLASPPADR